MTLGITSSIAPDTPDFAGKPTWEMRVWGYMRHLFSTNGWTLCIIRVACCILTSLTWKAICPEKSYMPHECMRLKVFRMASALKTRSPVIGQIPPLARVAAMILPDSQVTSMEQSWVQNSISLILNRLKQSTVASITWIKYSSQSNLPESRSQGHQSFLLWEENTGE